MYYATKKFRFEMGHKLSGAYTKACLDPHGHTYTLEVTVKSTLLDNYGMVMDFKRLKEIVQPLVNKFDHKFLIHGENFDKNPTAENIADYFWDKIVKKIRIGYDGKLMPVPEVELHKITLWETADSCVCVKK